jgi:iron(III) transport system substrate-binding protein
VAAGQRWDDVVAAAQQEGVVVLAGPPAAAIRDGLNAFTEKYKIQVDYLAGQEGQHYARIEPEFAAGKLTVDLYLGGPNVPILRMSPNRMLDPLKPTLLLPEVGCGNWLTTDSCPWFLDPDEQYILKLGNYLSGAVYVNTKNVDPASLTSWDDLLTPRFKRRLVGHDPAPPGGSGTATARWLILIKGEDFVRRLYKDQEMATSANATQVAEWLARGTHDVAIGASPSAIAPLLARGLPIQAVPLAGAPLNMSGGFLGAMARLKNAPHPNAATVLTNWLLTRDGAEMLGRATDIAVTRNDATNDWMHPWQIPSPNGE